MEQTSGAMSPPLYSASTPFVGADLCVSLVLNASIYAPPSDIYKPVIS